MGGVTLKDLEEMDVEMIEGQVRRMSEQKEREKIAMDAARSRS